MAPPGPGSSKKKGKDKGDKPKKDKNRNKTNDGGGGGGAKGGGGGGGGGSKGSSLDNLIESGNEHMAYERFEEGLSDLKRACQLAPGSADAAEAYGMALAEFGDPREAGPARRCPPRHRMPSN